MTSIADRIDELNKEFDNRTFERHQMGEEKYGAGTWLGVDTIESAMLEVLDLANYARYTYIKLGLLRDGIAGIQTDRVANVPLPGKEMLGKQGDLYKGGIPE